MSEELPEGWASAKLGDAGKWCSGGTPSRSVPAYFGGDIPWVKSGDLNDGLLSSTEERITRAALENSSAKLMPKGSVSIAMYGATIGKLAVLDIDAATNQACANCRVNESVEKWYLYYYLMSQREEFVGAGQGGAQPNISATIIKDWPFPVPPLAEQRRIVAKIDALMGRLNAARERLEKVPLLLKRFRQSVLAKACTGRLTEDWRIARGVLQQGTSRELARSERRRAWAAAKPIRKLVNYPEPPTASIESVYPVEWEFALGAELFLWGSGEFLPKNKQAAGNVPVFGGNGVSGTHCKAMTKQPTIVIGRVGAHCGNAHVTTGPTWVTDNAIYATWTTAYINLSFTRMYLMHENINAKAGGTGQPFVSQQMLNELIFPLPPIEEQLEIVRRFEGLVAIATAVEVRLKEASGLLGKVKQAVLGAAFRGTLVPTEADLASAEVREFEHAEILLQRIASSTPDAGTGLRSTSASSKATTELAEGS